MQSDFPRHCSPFGVSVFAQGWSRDKFVHACNVLAQMLDNDQDGCADDAEVVKMMRRNQGGMIMFRNEKSGENYKWRLLPETFRGQALYASETSLQCSGSNETKNCRDAALEEIFHVISDFGISPAYSKTFGTCFKGYNSRSVMQEQMDIARGGHFVSVPKKYPSGSIYHYDDKTCKYDCQGTEFFYWTVTSLLDGQDARVNWNADEWEASTKSQLQNKAPMMYDLLSNGGVTSMILLSSEGVLPGSNSNGAVATYMPSSQTCDGGCALDGSGCGTLGNNPDADHCETDPVSDCIDSSLNLWIQKASRPCSWIAEDTSRWCKKKAVASHCPETCDACNKYMCSDSKKVFVMDGKRRKCEWAKKNTDRCDKDGMPSVCRETCLYCDS